MLEKKVSCDILDETVLNCYSDQTIRECIKMSEQKNIITKEINDAINKVQLFEIDAPPDFHKVLLEVKKQFDNCRLQLEAKKYFVACFGALKAGKSTLMNALAEKKVSPAGAGETTLRCSIILSADQQHPEGITLYRSKMLKAADSEEELNQRIKRLFSYFQGIITKEENENNFDSMFFPFSKLAHILTDTNIDDLQQFRDFEIAEIRINVAAADNILKEDVALIDMPGIDGVLAGIDGSQNNKTRKSLLKFIPNNCQHLLWVQSTMSAINETTYRRLDEFKAEKSSTPIFSVLNVVKAKGEWLSPEAQDKEINEASIIYKFDEDVFNINAAMAWAAYDFKNIEKSLRTDLVITPEYLLDESHIKPLKQALLNSVKNDGKKIIIRDALVQIENAYNKLNDEKSNIQIHLKEVKDKIERNTHALEQLKLEYENAKKLIVLPGDSNEDKARRAGLVTEIKARYWNEDHPEYIANSLPKLGNIKARITIPSDANVNKEIQKSAINACIEQIDRDIQQVYDSFIGNLQAFAKNKLDEKKSAIENTLQNSRMKGILPKLILTQSLLNLMSRPRTKMRAWIDCNNIDIYEVADIGLNIRLPGYRKSKELKDHMDKRLENYISFLCVQMDVFLEEFVAEIDNVHKSYCLTCLSTFKMIIDKEIIEIEKQNRQLTQTKERINAIIASWRKVRDDSVKYKQTIDN